MIQTHIPQWLRKIIQIPLLIVQMREVIERTEIIQPIEPHIERRINTPLLLQVAQLVHILHVHPTQHIDHRLVGHVLRLPLVPLIVEATPTLVVLAVVTLPVVIVPGLHVVFFIPRLALLVVVVG